MKIALFNPLSGLQVRGISKVADELAVHLKKEGHTVVEIKLPKLLYFRSNLLKIFVLIVYQQIICPIIALRNRVEMIIDPYNGFSIIGAMLIRTKYFIHDYTPFKRKFWYLRPGTIYQFSMFKLDSWFFLAEMYHDASDIDTPKFLGRANPPRIFPCIVDALDRSYSAFYDENVRPICDAADDNILVISTISGSGWNKDYTGLINNLMKINKQFILVAFGFGDIESNCEEVVMQNGICSHILTVGYVDEASISSTIAESDLFVFHSLSEGFGRPILEALQLKKTIVSTINAPVLNLLSEDAMSNIYLYDSGDEFLTAIELALSSTFKEISHIYKPNVDHSIAHFLR